MAGNVEVGAQRPPHIARIDALLDGLQSGAPAQSG